MSALAELLQEQMRAKHWSQSELARQIGVYPDYIKRWIDGDVPQPRMCAQIAEGLGLPVSVVMQAAGYPTDTELDDPQWELVQRQVREVYDQFDRAQWSKLTALIEVGLSLLADPLEKSGGEAPEKPPDEREIRGSAAPRSRKTESFPEPNDRLIRSVG